MIFTSSYFVCKIFCDNSIRIDRTPRIIITIIIIIIISCHFWFVRLLIKGEWFVRSFVYYFFLFWRIKRSKEKNFLNYLENWFTQRESKFLFFFSPFFFFSWSFRSFRKSWKNFYTIIVGSTEHSRTYWQL